MESCAPGLTSWNFLFFFFPFIEKLHPPVCSSKPASLQARGIAIRAKVKQKGGVDFSILGKNKIIVPDKADLIHELKRAEL